MLLYWFCNYSLPDAKTKLLKLGKGETTRFDAKRKEETARLEAKRKGETTRLDPKGKIRAQDEYELPQLQEKQQWQYTTDLDSNTKLALELAIDKLSTADKQLIKMKYIEGYRLAEIAQALNITDSAAKERLFRARKKLRLILGSTFRE